MGRKSQKAKEKKKLRKEENAKFDISLAKVEAANKLEDPMEALLPFKKYDRNGLKVMIECKKVADLDTDTIDFIFDLTKDNMKTLYEQSEWGWKDREKREEMTDEKAWYLIARDPDSKPVAFVHFRFDMEYDEEIVYCYELQLIKDIRRKGLGKFLMQILELIAHKTSMLKVMLTAFKHNEEGYNFFTKTMKYQLDETSPEDPIFDESYSYQILSKVIPLKKPSNQGDAASASVQTNGTENGLTS